MIEETQLGQGKKLNVAGCGDSGEGEVGTGGRRWVKWIQESGKGEVSQAET